ncbi:MAG: N-acetylmuramoyl-L-alanine amidase family protein [Clostridium beijerinckii]|uniref:N-acetylmuramoyl-L-alanine amidase family protein n=1 Tax=Clostridium beijerinckii TaxID=1520 RepID=UPI002430B995|nr:N-acetylmuramoyl-L-alanine amidase family protein [Clostridium beijerinckii]MCI1478335.1 N-acetylmuramoyl-L-alanine amidase family protein [Clostridium beijerinckii]MCI1578841.1 N-acetylmuramoyl-L-alanine amidase family protein [Clostridium beijerinckii]MCI1582330.1 N-acetylmuramoyl-L-alanine amidase family protein [Clostridium beijerinckii]MCI1622847.1 N-acetylmuramoyl-L-alanine amidase family protein [Clostridium beijerinckii]MDG5855255.1 N-acetylmuramoyl-L-alanine amidase family protein 
MKSLKLKKLVAVALVGLTVAALSPIGASAEWKQDSNGWWNTEGNSYSTGWRSINGNWYYFDSTGYMKTGWANDGGTWYYMQPSGEMKTGWINDGATWYYADPSGAMKTGWVNDSGTWYYLQSSGAMKTGWINDGGAWYFASASGAMQTGVVEVNGKVYYLEPNGAMATGNVTINGAVYTFAASGEATGDKIPTPTVAFSGNGAKVTPSTTGGNTGSTGSNGSSGGGGSNHSSGGSTTTFQGDINSKYADYAKVTINKNASDAKATFTVSFNKAADSTTGGDKDYVTQDILVTNANGTDEGIEYNNGEYTAPLGSIVYSTARVYRDGQVGYVTTKQTITK